MAAVTVLTALALPLWGRSSTPKTLLCMDNLRRLTAAWLTFAADHDGQFTGNVQGTSSSVPGLTVKPWTVGWLDWSTSPNNTNTAFLTDPRYVSLAPYVANDTTLFKCPADDYLSPVQANRGWLARVRSYSMNAFMGEGNQGSSPIGGSGFRIFKKWSDFRRLSPAAAFVFTEEHPDSINDPMLLISLNQWGWLDLPGSLHEGRGWFSLADGHLELRQWLGRIGSLPVQFRATLLPPAPPNDPDLLWLREHSSERAVD
jgi:hypothetical protein